MIKEEEVLKIIESHRTLEIQSGLQFACSRMSLPLYMAFWIADIIYAPQYLWRFLFLRATVIPAALWIYYNIHKFNSLKKVETIALFYGFLCSSVINIMIFLTEGSISPYYAGLNLISIGSLYFIPWRTKTLLWLILLIYGPFYAIAARDILILKNTHLISTFFINNFFISSTLVISIVIRLFNFENKKKIVRSQLALEIEINTREQIIQEKTREAIRLSALTKQFSPQVVHEISKGNLDITMSHRRVKICALFIDIVNSTDRVNRIDKDDLDKVITSFMEDTMRVLLKYDITIDKFLGDGVLAFSNAPLERIDYVERAINAALEIRDRILLNRETYLRYWLNELQIRIGISAGYANVGFYGSEEYFKSYTAIGRVVNMASRLCSSSEPNQIVVDNEAIKSIKTSDYSIKEVGYKKLKGFEQDMIQVFEVNKIQDQSIDHNIPTCPNGHGILHFDTNEKGIYELKCRTCQFVQTQPLKINTDKKAS